MNLINSSWMKFMIKCHLEQKIPSQYPKNNFIKWDPDLSEQLRSGQDRMLRLIFTILIVTSTLESVAAQNNVKTLKQLKNLVTQQRQW